MKEPDEPSKTDLLRALGLARAVQTAPGPDEALDRILETTRSLTKADVIVYFERDERGRLKLTRDESRREASESEVEICLKEAQAALERYAARRKEAAERRAPVRNVGTDDKKSVTAFAKVLWAEDRFFGVLAIAGRDFRDIDQSRLAIFSSIAEQAAIGLAKRHVNPPATTDPALEAEKKKVQTRRITSAQIDRRAGAARALFVGSGAHYREILGKVERYADSRLPLIIRGESGTGKEVIARLVHDASPWRSGPFAAVNVAAIPSSLFESELFGHKAGAFTGAVKDFPGKARAAEGGTIFLDEIGELSPENQAKLLRFVQSGEVTPVGAAEPVHVNARLVTATNRPLEDMVREETFRLDLFYRLSALEIGLKPLRERRDDLPALVEHFLERARGTGPVRALAKDAWDVLLAHDWPGNVRELEQVIARAVLNAGPSLAITRQHMELRPLGKAAAKRPRTVPLDEAKKALDARGGNMTRAAADLGINVRSLRRIFDREGT